MRGGLGRPRDVKEATSLSTSCSVPPFTYETAQQHGIILLGGLTGRLDQTVHTLSYLHKLRNKRDRVFAVTDENIGWVLDSVRTSIHCRRIDTLISLYS